MHSRGESDEERTPQVAGFNFAAVSPFGGFWLGVFGILRIDQSAPLFSEIYETMGISL